jgi:hypothetical protein
MQIQTKRDSPPKYLANFWSITAFLRPRFHPSFLVYNTTFDNSIPDSLAYDIFSIFLRIQMKFNTNISEGDTGVGKGESSNSSFDNVLTKSDDESVSIVLFKLGNVLGKSILELREGACADS